MRRLAGMHLSSPLEICARCLLKGCKEMRRAVDPQSLVAGAEIHGVHATPRWTRTARTGFPRHIGSMVGSVRMLFEWLRGRTLVEAHFPPPIDELP
jgi:hypothetical protein